MTRLLSSAVVVLITSGCIDQARVNALCKWTPEAVDAAGLQGEQFQWHLDRDVELATDLAVRYADVTNQMRSGYEGHGGLIEEGALRDRCMSTLLSDIAVTHQLPLDLVVAVRTRHRRPLVWDAMVISVFALLYVIASWFIASAISSRFPPDEGWPALAAPVIASFGISIGAIGLFQLWAMILEMVRLGNDHVSGYRASWNPWTDHLATLYIGGIVLFGVSAGAYYRLQRRRFEAIGHAV